MINDEVAFEQKYDFEALFPVANRLTDSDSNMYLPNGLKVMGEFKKDTLNHTVEEIVNSNQWKLYRDFYKDDVYLIYATHNEEVTDKPINSSNLTVRYVELDGKPIEFKQGIKLYNFLNGLGSIGMYCIKVHYPQGNSEFALKQPVDDKWTSISYVSGNSAFETEEECLNYIKTRYEKEFNREYKYSIYKIESMNAAPTVIHRYTYEEIIGL